MSLIVPENIYSTAIRLAVDLTAELLFRRTGRVQLHPRILTYEDAVSVCRRSLEIAVHSANSREEEAHSGEYAAEWEALEKADTRAALSLRHALKLRSRGNMPPYPEAGLAALLPSLRQFHAHEGAISDIRERSAAAAADAEILVKADDLLVRLADHDRRAAKRIRSGRPNPGQPVKLTFVAILAEGWMFLTGRRPGRQPQRNPFLDFVSSAWDDAGGTRDQDFHRQLRSVVAGIPESVDPDSIDYYPSWL